MKRRNTMVWQNVLDKFIELFGDEGEIGVYFAPGRVNMIGEHTDYNGGHVFPCALTIGTYGVARKRNDKKLRFYSLNFEHLGVIESSVENMKQVNPDVQFIRISSKTGEGFDSWIQFLLDKLQIG